MANVYSVVFNVSHLVATTFTDVALFTVPTGFQYVLREVHVYQHPQDFNDSLLLYVAGLVSGSITAFYSLGLPVGGFAIDQWTGRMVLQPAEVVRAQYQMTSGHACDVRLSGYQLTLP